MEHYWPLFPSYLAGASVALLLVLAFREVQFTAIALILPLLLICYLTLRSSFGRLEDAKQHVDAAEPAAALDGRNAGDGDRREGRSHARSRAPRAAGHAGAGAEPWA